MQKKKIEQRADRVLQAFQYNDGEDIYVDAVKLARFFGFTVEEKADLMETEDGSVTVSEDGTQRNIVINDNRSIETKRFIIVHELAHYLLHYMGAGKFFRHRENTKGKNLEENDADYLAACLLMPTKSFRTQYNIAKKDKPQQGIVADLQNKFRTPWESIERRINEICR